MLTVFKKQGLQVGDIFRWKNPFYGNEKHQVPDDRLHFIAGDRPAIVTKVTKDKITFYPFRSKIFGTGQVHLMRSSEFNDGLKDEINAIVPERHCVHHEEFMTMVDYYIGTLNKAAVEMINDSMQSYLYNTEIPSTVVKGRTTCLRPGKIIRIGKTEYLVMSVNGNLINIIPFTKLTYLEASRQGHNLQFGYDHDVTFQYLDYDAYKTVSSKNQEIEVLDYIDEDMIPKVYHELCNFMMKKINVFNGEIFKDAIDKIQEALDNAKEIYNKPQAVQNQSVVVTAEVEEDEVIDEDIPEVTIENKEPATFQAVKTGQLTALEQLRNELAIKETIEKTEKVVPFTREQEMDELHASKLAEYFIPTNKSRYLKEITTPEELLNAICETSGSFTIRTGKSEAVFNYRKKLILESIVKCKAPLVIKKYI